ncbi:MAG: DUF1826 domain-containing protein [Sneathiella sp.]
MLSSRPDSHLEKSASTFAEVGKTAPILQKITEPTVCLALWQRETTFLSELTFPAAPWKSWQDFKETLSLEDVKKRVEAHLLQSTDFSQKNRSVLVQDIQKLAASYSQLSGSEKITLRLSCVTNDACRYFHADYIPYRLSTTYFGPGTRYADPDTGWSPASSGEIPPATDIYSLKTGEVAVMQGAFSSARKSVKPLYHQSPPISGTSNWRFFLAIDNSEEIKQSLT